eukprot:319465-Hanusia_phi.AAC.1
MKINPPRELTTFFAWPATERVGRRRRRRRRRGGGGGGGGGEEEEEEEKEKEEEEEERRRRRGGGGGGGGGYKNQIPLLVSPVTHVVNGEFTDAERKTR